MKRRRQDDDSPALQGAVVCCTAMPPEKRSAIADKVQAMGGVHKLDLTSDVTHLIIGNIDTPKYKYVAKERSDIKALRPEWIDAVLGKWKEGGDVDVAALEESYRCPTFDGLQICVTGFEDQRQRDSIQQTVVENGACYHGDLTKAVTHLIAATPRGKKYEYAGQWGIKIVSLEWLSDSLSRGMSLEESYYNPLLPVEERGKGAINHKAQVSPQSLQKSFTNVQPMAPEEFGKRKLRRTTSSKLESQNDDLWADIGSRETELGHDASNVWSENTRVSPRKRPVSKPDEHPGSDEATPGAQENIVSHSKPSLSYKKQADGIFEGSRVLIAGFDSRKEPVLLGYLESNGAQVVDESFFRLRKRGALEVDSVLDPLQVTIIIPHDTDEKTFEQLQQNKLNDATLDDPVVSEWWVEKCIFTKSLVDQKLRLCKPLSNIPVVGFENITICPTSFSGIDLLHFSKAVKIKGAKYDETLTFMVSVLVCNGDDPRRDKVKYALQNQIPVVSADWFNDCISQQKCLPFEEYSLGPVSQAAWNTKLSFYNPSSNPRPVSTNLNRHRHKQDNVAQGKTGSRSKSAETSTSTNTSRPLQDLPPAMNSPHRISRPTSNTPKSNNSPTRQDSPKKSLSAGDKPSTNSSSSTDPAKSANLDTAIALLLAHKKSTNAHASAPAPASASSTANSLPASPQSRRHRPLGRAPSNPSRLSRTSSLTNIKTANFKPPRLSIADSYDGATDSQSLSLPVTSVPHPHANAASPTIPPTADINVDTDANASTQHFPPTSATAKVPASFAFRPSQALEYEDPEMTAARRKMLGRTRVEESTIAEPSVGRARDVVDLVDAKGLDSASEMHVKNEEGDDQKQDIGVGKRRSTRTLRART